MAMVPWAWLAWGNRLSAVELPADNRALRTIFNNDANNVIYALDSDMTPEEVDKDYRRAVEQIAETRFGVMAQNVGNPDPVIYRSQEATLWSKYIEGHEGDAMNKLMEVGTDQLQVTIDVCHAHDVPVVASYRMNAEDFYEKGLLIQDFGRKHWHLAIPGAHCLDPAHPVVYKHRMAIFREVVENYDIEGIEFDFRRWTHMISDPLNNHPILTRMVRETRQMLDEVAKKKGKRRLLLGVRVGPSIDTPQDVAKYAGVGTGRKVDQSCKELGLDVKTWIHESLVDYVSPSLFWPDWPGLPRTPEFVELAKGRNVGIYPTIFPRPSWLNDSGDVVNRGPVEPGENEKLQEYKDGFCKLALQSYDEGADGVSTYNWYFHLHLARSPRQWQAYYGYGMGGSAIQKYVLSVLGDPQAIRTYQKQPWFWPAEYESLLSDYRPIEKFVHVEQPRSLPAKSAALRFPAGIADDHAPSLGMLPNGDILLVMSHRYNERAVDPSQGEALIRDENYLTRFNAANNKFSGRTKIPLIGRNPYLSVASDGTIHVTTQLMPNDSANLRRQTIGFLHRSGDAAKRWSATTVTANDVPNADPGAAVGLTRNVLELSDGTLVVGVSAGNAHALWRSTDHGLEWDRTRVASLGSGNDSSPGLGFSGGLLWETESKELALLAAEKQSIVMAKSNDGGQTWRRVGEIRAEGGFFYPSIVRLDGARRLVSYAALSSAELRATLASETSEGLAFNWQNDRIVLDRREPIGQAAGGKYGNTIDAGKGRLMTAYAYRDARGVMHVEVVQWDRPVTP